MELVFAISLLLFLIPGFEDSVPPTADKVFKIETSPDIIESIKTIADSSLPFWGFDIKIKPNVYDTLEVKVPKNLPTPASYVDSWHYDHRTFVIADGFEIAYEEQDDPCFFHYKIPVNNQTEIEIAYPVILSGTHRLYSPVEFDRSHQCYDMVFYQKQDSPLKQFKDGIAWYNIACNDDKVIVQKIANHPACVSFDTAIKLYKRGWATNMENEIWYQWANRTVIDYFNSKLAKKYNADEASIRVGVSASRESLPPLLTVELQFTSMKEKKDQLLWFGISQGDHIDKILEIDKDGQKKEIRVERSHGDKN